MVQRISAFPFRTPSNSTRNGSTSTSLKRRQTRRANRLWGLPSILPTHLERAATQFLVQHWSDRAPFTKHRTDRRQANRDAPQEIQILVEFPKWRHSPGP